MKRRFLKPTIGKIILTLLLLLPLILMILYEAGINEYLFMRGPLMVLSFPAIIILNSFLTRTQGWTAKTLFFVSEIFVNYLLSCLLFWVYFLIRDRFKHRNKSI